MRIVFKLRFFVLAFSFLSFTIDQANSQSENSENAAPISINQITALLDITVGQLDELDAIVQRLILVLNNQDLGLDEATKTGIRTQMLATRNLLTQLKSNAILNPDLIVIHTLAHAGHSLISQVRQASQNALRSWPPLLEIKRDTMDPSEASIQKQLALNAGDLEELQEESCEIGVGSYRRWYKKMTQKLNLLQAKVAPYWKKYADWVTVSTGLASYILYKTIAPTDNRFEKLLNKFGIDSSPKVVVGGLAASSIVTPWIDAKITTLTKDHKLVDWAFATSSLLAANLLKDQALQKDSKPYKAALLGYYAWLLGCTRTTAISKFVTEEAKKAHKWLKGDLPLVDPKLSTTKPQVTFDDVIGNDESKQKLQVLIDYIANPKKFDLAGLAPERGYLFVGASRSGKSHLAKALFGEIKKLAKHERVRFKEVSAAQINKSGFFPVAIAAESLAPCIMFIDEIDLLNLNRNDHGKPNELLSEMLTWMSGEINAPVDKRVIVVAATNRPDKIDFALLQHGRFGELIELRYPSYAERLAYLQKKLEKNSIILPLQLCEQLAKETADCSFDDLGAIINNALQCAVCAKRAVQITDFQAALDHSIRKITLENSSDLHENELKIVAAHQAGRALATILLQPNEIISLVTTKAVKHEIPNMPAEKNISYIAQSHYGLTVSYPRADRKVLNDTASLQEHCQIELAGPAAQQLLIGTCAYDYQPCEQQKAFDIANAIVLTGQNPKALSKKMRGEKLDAAYLLKNNLQAKVTTLLAAQRNLLEKFYQALLEKRVLREDDIYTLVASVSAANATNSETPSIWS